MSNNTTSSGITSPTQYTLLDNNHKYLPRKFTFVPTVSSESGDDITETVANALSNGEYYECTPHDFVCNIKVRNDLGEDVVYKADNKSAYVYKINSDENDVYKYCEDTVKVSIVALGDANINIGNVTVTKDNDVLKPLATNLDCTVSGTTKEITVPQEYDSLEINSSDVFFRQKRDSESLSWVKIIENDGNKQVFFSNIQLKLGILASFIGDSNWYIQLDTTKYQIHNLYIFTDLSNAKTVLSNAKTVLSKAKTDLSNAETDLNNAETDLSKAKTDLSNAETQLNNLKTMCNEFTNNLSTDKRSYLPETITRLSTLDVSKIYTNLNLAINCLNSSEQDLEATKDYLDNEIVALNNLITSIDNIIRSDEYIYVIDNNNNLVGLTTEPNNSNKLWLFIDKWLEEVCSYCMNNLSTYTIFNFYFLDVNQQMIIHQKTNSDSSYDLVYLEGDGQNGNRILPEGDYFLTASTNP